MKTFNVPIIYRSPLINAIKNRRRVQDKMKKDYSPTLLDFGPLQIYLARHFGFCYGVENAIEISFRTIDENPGIPLIYSGQEMPNMERLKFFDKDTIEWTKENLLHDFYKALLECRMRNPALRSGDPNVTTTFVRTNAPQHILGWRREAGDKQVLVLLNLSSHEHEFLVEDAARVKYTNIFDKKTLELIPDKPMKVGPWESLVLEK